MDEQRLIELEIKVSHQDIAIDELQRVLFEQHKIIEKLKKDLMLLTQRFDGVTGGPDIGPANERPPHY